MSTAALYIAIFVTPLVLELAGLMERDADREAQGLGYGIMMVFFSAICAHRWKSIFTPSACESGIARGAELSGAFVTGILSAASGLLLTSYALDWRFFQVEGPVKDPRESFGLAVWVIGGAYVVGFSAAFALCRYSLRQIGTFAIRQSRNQATQSDGEPA